MPESSKRDKLSAGPTTTESLGISSSAGLTEGLMGTAPLFPNYDDTTEITKSDSKKVSKQNAE